MMSGLTENGLKIQIKHLEEIIKLGKERSKDCSFEMGLLKEYRKYLKGGRLHHKLAPEATK